MLRYNLEVWAVYAFVILYVTFLPRYISYVAVVASASRLSQLPRVTRDQLQDIHFDLGYAHSELDNLLFRARVGISRGKTMQNCCRYSITAFKFKLSISSLSLLPK